MIVWTTDDNVIGGSFLSFRIHKRSPLTEAPFFEKKFRLADGVLQRLAGLERRDLHRGDGDLLCRVAGVHAGASCTLADAERSETGDRNGGALLELLRDHGGQCLERHRSCALRDACCICDISDEILLGHKRGRKEVK